jgi:hypothetical protein
MWVHCFPIITNFLVSKKYANLEERENQEESSSFDTDEEDETGEKVPFLEYS